MIYRIVIVDDESYIADTTAMRLQNDFSEETEMKVFYDPEDAVSYAREYRVDILITDIRMPNMTGLELVQKISDFWPMCQMILLSAYAHFDYLYEAQKGGQVAYVLKRDGYDALCETVSRAFAQLKNAQLREEQMILTRQHSYISQTLLTQSFLTDLVHGKMNSEDTVSYGMRQVQMEIDVLKPAYVSFGILKKSSECVTVMDRLERANRIELIAKLCMPSRARLVVTEIVENHFLWLMQFDANSARFRPEEILDAVQSQLTSHENIEMSFLYCAEPVLWSQYPSLYLRMFQAAFRKSADETMWLQEMTANTGEGSDEVEETARMYLWRWKQSIQTGNAQSQDDLTALLKLLASLPSVQDSLYRWLYTQIAMEFAGQMLSSDSSSLKTVETLYTPASHATPSNGAQFLIQVDAWLRQKEGQRISETTRSVIGMVQEYISSHLGDDISLTKLSESVHISPAYLSRIFKQETGGNIKDFITSMRVSRACDMLKNENKKIQDISQELGFQTPSYFSYFFKKNMGVTPKEFRERLFQS